MIPKSDIYIIIPAFNEESTIEDVIRELLPLGYEIIVVDDGSHLDLRFLLKSLNITVLRHRINLGQGAALCTGIRFALQKDAHYFITFDADGQHNAVDIECLLSPLRKGTADITLGSRFLQPNKTVPQKRKLLLKIATCINYLFTGLLLSDAHNGLRGLNRKAAELIKIRQDGMAHATEILSELRKHRLKFKEVPVTINYTKYSMRKGQKTINSLRILFDLLLEKILK